jgi:hypothetical protein
VHFVWVNTDCLAVIPSIVIVAVTTGGIVLVMRVSKMTDDELKKWKQQNPFTPINPNPMKDQEDR